MARARLGSGNFLTRILAYASQYAMNASKQVRDVNRPICSLGEEEFSGIQWCYAANAGRECSGLASNHLRDGTIATPGARFLLTADRRFLSLCALLPEVSQMRDLFSMSGLPVRGERQSRRAGHRVDHGAALRLRNVRADGIPSGHHGWCSHCVCRRPSMARLPGATTFGRLRGAPLDPDPFSPETGVVIHPTVARAVYAYPGGKPVAVLPASELSSPTWVPVVQTRPGGTGYCCRPGRTVRRGGSSGRRRAADRDSAYRIEIDVAAYRLTVLDGGRRLGSWTVAVGGPGHAHPTGRTFLLASVAP